MLSSGGGKGQPFFVVGNRTIYEVKGPGRCMKPVMCMVGWDKFSRCVLQCNIFYSTKSSLCGNGFMYK